jgi:CheY-like chemotaxis protein
LLQPLQHHEAVAGRQADIYRRSETASGAPLVTRHSLREAPRRLRILVAEDNAVNQTLVMRVLDKMGHTAVIAQNGKEALSLATTQHFDVVFMDIQMPEMDGLAATRAIRDWEQTRGLHVPIHAMTAHAMKGDRERCLQSGMDGYVPKPVRFSDIEEILARLSQPEPAPAALWARQEALDRVGGDEALLQELCQIFLRESPKLLERLRAAIAASDAAELERAAHSLKGEAGYLSGSGASRVAQQLQETAGRNDLSRAPELFAMLEQEVAALRIAMQEPAGARP